MATDAIVVSTKKAHNDWSSSKLRDTLVGFRDYIQNNWESGIEDGNSNYNLTMFKSTAVEIDLDSPSDTSEALSQSRSYIENQTSLFGTYDSVLVVDSRTYSDALGRAYQETAGTNYGVGFVAGDGGDATAGMELGHNYGGAHGQVDPPTFESTATHHSIMGEAGVEDCNNNLSLTVQGHWYSDCTQTAVRNYMDNNGLD